MSVGDITTLNATLNFVREYVSISASMVAFVEGSSPTATAALPRRRAHLSSSRPSAFFVHDHIT
jgi:hypothetical protein